jgi:poly(3-hydroxyalkanoate) synthetase
LQHAIGNQKAADYVDCGQHDRHKAQNACSRNILATKIAPIKAIPETALAPDINGVCKVGGTLLITSAPAKVAKVKIKTAVIMAADIFLTSKLQRAAYF